MRCEMLELAELIDGEGAVDVAQTVIEAERGHFVIPGIDLRIAGGALEAGFLIGEIGGLAIDAVIAEHGEAPGEIGLARQRRAAFAGGDVLHRMKGEDRDIAVGAAADRGPAAIVPLIARAERMTGIFDDGEAFMARTGGDGFEIGALPGEIDREHRGGAAAVTLQLRQRGLELRQLHQPARGIAIGEDHFGAGETRGVGGGGEGHGRRDHGMIRADAEGEAGEVKRGGAVGAADRRNRRRSAAPARPRSRGPWGPW